MCKLCANELAALGKSERTVFGAWARLFCLVFAQRIKSIFNILPLHSTQKSRIYYGCICVVGASTHSAHSASTVVNHDSLSSASFSFRRCVERVKLVCVCESKTGKFIDFVSYVLFFSAFFSTLFSARLCDFIIIFPFLHAAVFFFVDLCFSFILKRRLVMCRSRCAFFRSLFSFSLCHFGVSFRLCHIQFAAALVQNEYKSQTH